MIIAPARTADLDQILALEQTGFDHGWSREAWAAELAADDRYVLVNRDADGQVIGVATFQTSGDFADLLRVVVAPQWRHQGVAQRLVRAGIEWAQATGAHRMLLEVEQTNASAHRLYERFGFEPIDRRLDYYGRDRHAMVMELDLARFDEPVGVAS
ncbi:MAG: GNAT family N-acetyltransferase [Actinomycetia bacterium]|nr:GNAT family N-acetyltransferase [Actinomycetes bacterium]